MDKENTTKDIILEQGFIKFSQEGVRNFTVESLAANLGMSKKTIYKFFPTKEILIDKVVCFFTSAVEKKIKFIVESDRNPIEKFENFMNFLIMKIGYLKMENAMEVKVRHPRIWDKIEKFRLSLVEYIAAIFKEAQDKGYAKSDLDMDNIAIIYMNIINSTFQPEFFLKNNLAPSDTIRTFVKIVTEGIFIDTVEKKHNHNKLIWES